MFGLGATKKKVILVLDIGSASAAAAIVEMHLGAPSMILTSNRVNISSEKKTSEQAASGLASALGEAIDITLKKNAPQSETKNHLVGDIYVFFRSPWARSRATYIVEHLDGEKKITDATIDALAKKAISENVADGQSPLEAIILRTEVNGYPTAHPTGKLAHELSLSILASSGDPLLVRAVAAVIEKKFPAHKPHWRTHTRALLSVIRDSNHLKNCMVIDMTSEGTSAIVIRDSALDEELTISEGVHSILERLSPNALPEETMSLVRMLERDQCSGDSCDALRESMGKVEQDLVRIFGETFAKYATSKRLPNEALLMVHPELSAWFERFFSRIDFSQFTLTSQPFSVRALSVQDLGTWVTAVSSVAPDISTMLAAALVHIDAESV